MRILRMITLLVLCLPYTILKPEKAVEQSTQSNQDPYGLVQYCEKVIKMSEAFGDKYSNQPRFMCTTCKKEILTHGDLIGLIFLCSMDVFTGVNKFSAAKKIMDEALEIFPQKPLDELVNFMLCAANDLQIGCVKCPGKHWTIIEYKK